MWSKTDHTEDLFIWRADERTASVTEKRTALAADAALGEVRFMHTDATGERHLIVLPPAVARTIGAALIEAGVIAGSVTR